MWHQGREGGREGGRYLEVAHLWHSSGVAAAIRGQCDRGCVLVPLRVCVCGGGGVMRFGPASGGLNGVGNGDSL
jgi:hypothetical protein